MIIAKVKSVCYEIEEWFECHQSLVIASLVLIFLGLLAYGIFGPDSGPGILREKLSDAGYDMTSIEFKKVNRDGFFPRESIYRSSHAIEYMPGEFIDEWKLTWHTLGFITHWAVSPYPELPRAVDLRLQISVSQEEYDRLSSQANGLPVEEYLEQTIYQIAAEGN